MKAGDAFWCLKHPVTWPCHETD